MAIPVSKNHHYLIDRQGRCALIDIHRRSAEIFMKGGYRESTRCDSYEEVHRWVDSHGIEWTYVDALTFWAAVRAL